MSKSYYSLGLMSGTSMDGIDASIIQSDGESNYKPIIDEYFEYPKSVYEKLTKLRDKIGMTGAWIPFNDLSVYWSNTRSMARFGLLMSANGKWETAQIISKNVINEATSTSQDMNKAYGY